MKNGCVAQWLEQSAHNRLVAGSNPATPKCNFLLKNKRKSLYIHQHDGDAGVTQLARVPAFQADCCGFEPRHPLHHERNQNFQPP